MKRIHLNNERVILNSESVILSCILVLLVFLVLFSSVSELYGNEENLEDEYSIALTKGGILSGTVWSSSDNDYGMGWIL